MAQAGPAVCHKSLIPKGLWHKINEKKVDFQGHLSYLICMGSYMIKRKIEDVQRRLARANDEAEIAQLKEDLRMWKRHLHDAEMIELEERVGFKRMEQNAGVWDER